MDIRKIFKKENRVMDERILWELEYDKATNLFIKDVGVEVFSEGERKRIPLKGIWDTGSSFCAMSKDIVKSLGIKPYKTGIETVSMNGSSKNDIYLMNIYITSIMLFKDIEVQATNFANSPYQFVIGMNIIKRGNLSFTHKEDCLLGHFERKEFD